MRPMTRTFTLLSLLLTLLILFTACGSGLSAYEIAVKNGFTGSETEWLESLKGDNGKDGTNGKDGVNGADAVGDTELNNRNINEAMLASVSIYCKFPKAGGGNSVSAGSGVIYQLDRASGDAYVITNYHVVFHTASTTADKISDNIRVYLYGMYFDSTENMEKTGIEATYIGGSMSYDLAVLKITGSERIKNSPAKAVKLADSNNITAGTTAIAIGNPEGYGISVTSGIISVESEYVQLPSSDKTRTLTMRLMRIDTSVNEGNSGGGLFNVKGEMIGLVNAKLNTTTAENIGYAIPSNIAVYGAQNIIDNCEGKENKSLLKCVMGITVTTVDSYAEYDDKSGKIALYDVVAVKEVSSLYGAYGTIKAGDVMKSLTLNGKTVAINRQYLLVDTLLGARVGDKVSVTVLRDGKEVTFETTFTEDNVLPAY